MASDKMTGGSNMGIFLQNDRLFCDSIWVPSASVSLRGTNSMVDFENVGGRDTTEPQFFQSHVSDENGDDDFDLCYTSAGKKRRLTAAQVQFLERNFELENKLEPERKVQLAKELGLQPRQVAIWFQNRRARFKNKQLQRDYDSLKASYDRLKLDYDKLIKENEFLKNEILSLREKLMIRNGKMEGLGPHDTSNSPNADHQNVVPNLVPEYVSNAPTIAIKQDDSSSANFDPDSPHSFWEPADSSRLLEPEQSDFSQDEDDNLSRRFLPLSPCLPKLYYDSPANSCTFEFPVEEQPLWSWTY